MDYLVIFLSLALYFFQAYGFLILVPLIYAIFYFAIRWAGVKTKTLCAGLTLLCVPILFWLWLVGPIFPIEDASELWTLAADLWSDAFTPSPMTPLLAYTSLSMLAGRILCALGIAKKRQRNKPPAAV
ncbi:MAG: hypothetical protein U1B84_28370 [Variovorax sp.]|nr:hypothetical protein [Variovorax sp.]